MRVGLGFDSHKLVEGRPLILGGVRIDFSRGLLGHSDGDCLIHAVCDALLGAMGGGDIGELFPDTDPKWKDASSCEFLSAVAKMLAGKNLSISNIDTTIIAGEPPMTPHRKAMREKIALLLGISADQVNIKAKRPEGFEQAAADVIVAQAVVCVRNNL